MEVFVKFKLLEFNREVSQKTGRLINKKTQVDTKGMNAMIHDNSSKIGVICPIIARGIFRVKFF